MFRVMSLALVSVMAMFGFGAEKAAARVTVSTTDGPQKNTVKSMFEDHGGCHCTAVGGVRG